MKKIKLLLYKILGIEKYLKIVSKVYLKYISLGFGKSKYAELHFLKEIIKSGFVCVDIGANLGYYSYFLSKFSGIEGKVYAVEPVEMFAKIWKKNTETSKYKNLELFPFALGEKQQEVKMGMPKVDGVVHHGMTKLIEEKTQDCEIDFIVQMQNPDVLFEKLEKIDFVKVDVEGYESIVFENMAKTILKHKPLIQSELSGQENRHKSIKILTQLGYEIKILKESQLQFADEALILDHQGDFYFTYKN